jgi:hypothetical protein
MVLKQVWLTRESRNKETRLTSLLIRSSQLLKKTNLSREELKLQMIS